MRTKRWLRLKSGPRKHRQDWIFVIEYLLISRLWLTVEILSIFKTNLTFLVIQLLNIEFPINAFMEKRIRVFIEVLPQVQVLKSPSQQGLYLLLFVGISYWLIHMAFKSINFSMISDQILIICNHFELFSVKVLKDRGKFLIFHQEVDVLWWVNALSQLQSSIQYLVNDSIGQVHHLLILLLDEEIDVLSTYLNATVEELVPNILRLDLLFQHRVGLVIRFRVDGCQLLLAAQQLCKGIFDEDDDVLLGQAWNYVFVNAQFLQTVQLEEISQP